ncbi:MAG: hypothetical protein BGN86_02685 [Caulobacterales bacterium 68-7]|nr:MAG: hypothetical protein BGN86_02685 [Caulobacterales bacterium 68-7]
MSKDINSPGRKANDAQPLGDRDGLVSDTSRDRTAAKALKSAGPDGADATEASPDGPAKR